MIRHCCDAALAIIEDRYRTVRLPAELCQPSGEMTRNAANGLGSCGEGTSSCPGLFPGIHVLAKVERRHGWDKPGHDEKEKSESLFQVVRERLKIPAAFSVILCGR
jgi:hypothetical protein